MRPHDKPLIRVTQIESYRRFAYQSESSPFEISEDSAIDSILSFEGNEYTRIGTAFHRIVEEGTPKCDKVAEGVREYTYYNKPVTEPVPCGRSFDVDGHHVILDIPQIKTALAYRNEHPQAFHEYRMYKDYGSCIVTGCADMIDGLEIHDIKTKYSTPYDDDYISSCQWRFYLEMAHLDIFHFDLFCFDGYKVDRHGYDVRGLPLTKREPPITCYRYPLMENDNLRLLNEFLQWAEQRNIMNYFYKQEI